MRTVIACYGWTNTLLLNLTNMKRRFFADTPGDLYVLQTARLSPALTDAIRASGVFRRVFLLQGTQLDQPGGRGAWDNAALLLRAGDERRHFEAQLVPCVPEEGYAALYCGALWAHTLHLYEAFARKNPALTVAFVEEGYANYMGARNLCRTLLCAEQKEKLYRRLHFPKTFSAAVAAVNGVYVYAPQAYQGEDALPRYALPAIERSDPVLGAILRAAAGEADDEPYRARRVCYFAGPDEAGMADAVFAQLMAQLPRRDVIYKRHPQTALDPALPEGVYIDGKNYCAEALLGVLPMEDRLLITRFSSAVTYPKRMFDQEPCVLFTYGLYPALSAEAERLDRFAGDLRAQYREPGRVLLPRTREELAGMLQGMGAGKMKE